MEIVDEAQEGAVAVLLAASSGAYAAEHDNLDAVHARVGTEVVLKDKADGSLFARPFHEQCELGSRVEIVAVDHVLEITQRVVAHRKFRDMRDHRAVDLVGNGKVFSVEILVQSAQHQRPVAHGLGAKRRALQSVALRDGNELN